MSITELERERQDEKRKFNLKYLEALKQKAEEFKVRKESKTTRTRKPIKFNDPNETYIMFKENDKGELEVDDTGSLE